MLYNGKMALFDKFSTTILMAFIDPISNKRTFKFQDWQFTIIQIIRHGRSSYFIDNFIAYSNFKRAHYLIRWASHISTLSIRREITLHRGKIRTEVLKYNESFFFLNIQKSCCNLIVSTCGFLRFNSPNNK